MFIDASALVSIIANEADGPRLRKKLMGSKKPHVSGMVIYESTLALMRLNKKTCAEVRAEVDIFIDLLEINFIDIDRDITDLATEAFARFGKGVHPAKLNMGDCFAYACAKKHRLPLLFKGNDFSKTDILKA